MEMHNRDLKEDIRDTRSRSSHETVAVDMRRPSHERRHTPVRLPTVGI